MAGQAPKIRMPGLAVIIGIALLYLSSATAAVGKDYYKLLGVRRNATEAEISKAYRKKARKLHPDIAPGKEEEFKDINTAYEVLKDNEKRQQYDLYGEEGLNAGAGSQQNGNQFYQFFRQGAGGHGGGQAGGHHFTFDMNGGFFDDIFEGFGQRAHTQNRGFTFNQGGGGGHKAASLFEGTVVSDVDLKEMISSLENIRTVNIYYFYLENCPHCQEGKKPFLEFATKYNGAVQTYAINCKKHNDACEKYRIEQVPQVVAFTDKNKPLHYQKRGFAENLVGFVSQLLPSQYTEVTSRKQLDAFLFQDNKLLKVVAIIKKGAYLIHLKALAQNLAGKISFAFIRGSNQQLAQLFGKDGLTQTGVLIAIDDVDSLHGRTIDLSTAAYHDVILRLNLMQYEEQRSHGIHGNDAKYSELNARKMDNGECTEKDNQFCFVFVKFGKAKEETLNEALYKIAQKYSNDPIKIRFINAVQQAGFAEAFGISSSCLFYQNCAKFIAYRGKRRKFEIMNDELTVENVDKFINDVISGCVTLKQTVTGVPKLADVTHTEL
ncbi:DnaJ protein erdj3a like protein [Babesia gibsoni]|uniref:DnaJ homolog subfamily C member 16 n=1 Tax=Babesia gibsoni TaxID=33632 RepID=A0AAD8UVM8_BABGI|nr:DnaJ protein erdj3a like protein [Babesia gibsoni]